MKAKIVDFLVAACISALLVFALLKCRTVVNIHVQPTINLKKDSIK